MYADPKPFLIPSEDDIFVPWTQSRAGIDGHAETCALER